MDIEIEGAVVAEHLRQNRTPNRGGHQQLHSETVVHIGSARDIAVELIAGSVSGCAGIVVGQPFDTVKVRLQMQNVPSGSGPQAAATSAATSAATLSATTTANATAARGISTLLELKNGQTRRYQGALACAVEAISKEGASALFKGMGTPLASAALVNAISFGAYAQSQRIFCASGLMVRETTTDEGETGPGNAGLFWSLMAGCVAGLFQTVVVIPTENIKVKLQVQVGGLGSSDLRYKGPVDCATKLIKEQGLRSLYRGTPATLIRDTPSMGLYFASYEGIKGWMRTQWGFSEEASSCWAGGLAGALSWAVIYPFDVVKSIQQAATDPLDLSSRSLSACLRSVYESAGGGIPGVRRLYRGLGTTLVRAVPVNAAIFPTYEWTVRVLNKAFPSSE